MVVCRIPEYQTPKTLQVGLSADIVGWMTRAIVENSEWVNPEDVTDYDLEEFIYEWAFHSMIDDEDGKIVYCADDDNCPDKANHGIS